MSADGKSNSEGNVVLKGDVLLDSQLRISKNIGTIQMKYIIWERFH